MLSGINVERIKLFSTKSPYWCLGIIYLAVCGLALAIGLADNGREATVATSQGGGPIGLMTFMIMATLSVTTEYRFGTIRNSFLAVPQRALVLASKTILLTTIGAFVGATSSYLAFLITKATAKRPPMPLELASGADYRTVFGHAALYAIGAVLAIGVGVLIRQSAGAISILLLWALVGEMLVMIVESWRKVVPYLPFNAGFNFVSAGGHGGMMGRASFMPGGPGALPGLGIFLVTAAVFWILALISLQRRDA